MDQIHTPLYSALLNHLSKEPNSFHVPGHKNGTVFPDIAVEHFQKILKLDLTELTGLDDLHDPESGISYAQKLVADLYNVRNSFFLVNGSTVGNLSMIMATCSYGDTVLVQRNSHKSILHGLELAGVRPVYLNPRYDNHVRVASHVPFSTIKKAIKEYPDAKALILTNPNYYGMTADLTEIVQHAHQYSIPVLVDEAHGAHFVLDSFPKSALEAGADIVVHSAHKTLPAMTMGSYLHVNSELVDVRVVSRYLQILQSSSPSYPIMASLDLARYYLASLKAQGTLEIVKQLNKFKQELREIKNIKVVESHNCVLETDPLKITIQTTSGYTGYQLQSLLEQKGIFSEMADPYNVLFVMPLSVTKNQSIVIEKIREAASEIDESSARIVYNQVELDDISELAVSYAQLKNYNKIAIDVAKAVSKIAGEMIIPYPPGIPLLMPGEIITQNHINMLESFLDTGVKFQGNKLKDRKIKVLE